MKEKRSPQYYKSKKMGYRAKSALKLLEIIERYILIEDPKIVVDLGAAPGSWSQVLREKLSQSMIISVDLQDMEPIENVIVLKEDITSESCFKKIKEITGGRLIDLLVSDCSHNVTGFPDGLTGFHDSDEYIQIQLILSALLQATKFSKLGSNFLTKCFYGSSNRFLISHISHFYKTVKLIKPYNSRDDSSEHFILCLCRIDCGKDPMKIDTDVNVDEKPIVYLEEGFEHEIHIFK